jgi:hypothetical protein
LGPTQQTNSAGVFARTVTAKPGTLIRVWSPQQHAYGWPLLVR